MKKYKFKVRKSVVKDIVIKSDNKEDALKKLLYYMNDMIEKNDIKYSILINKTIEEDEENITKNIIFSDENIEKITRNL